MKVHLLFEQSGTFKNEFKKLGFEAYDYDIENRYKETDYICDLYSIIENSFENKFTIFDTFKKDDLIMAFFPCIRFENQILLSFRGEMSSLLKWTMEKRLEYDLKLQAELNRNYELITKLALICIRKGLKLIIENPYSTQHYLITHWALRPSLIDYNRRDRGDYFEKPTAYYFVNCEPKNNLILETPNIIEKKRVDDCRKGIERSLISPQYANRFIREYILERR